MRVQLRKWSFLIHLHKMQELSEEKFRLELD